MELTDRYVRIHTQIEKTTQFVIHLVKKGKRSKRRRKRKLDFSRLDDSFFPPHPMACGLPIRDLHGTDDVGRLVRDLTRAGSRAEGRRKGGPAGDKRALRIREICKRSQPLCRHRFEAGPCDVRFRRVQA